MCVKFMVSAWVSTYCSWKQFTKLVPVIASGKQDQGLGSQAWEKNLCIAFPSFSVLYQVHVIIYSKNVLLRGAWLAQTEELPFLNSGL